MINKPIDIINFTRNVSSDRYFKNHSKYKVICVDFDNTICIDEWPYVGSIIKDAVKVLKELVNNGHKLILFTQRTKNYPICCSELEEYADMNGKSFSSELQCETVDILTPAINICKHYDIDFISYNTNAEWEMSTHDNSRKIFSDYVIDDHNVGMKYIIVRNSMQKMCKVCDWKFIDEWCVQEGLYNKNVCS